LACAFEHSYHKRPKLFGVYIVQKDFHLLLAEKLFQQGFQIAQILLVGMILNKVQKMDRELYGLV